MRPHLIFSRESKEEGKESVAEVTATITLPPTAATTSAAHVEEGTVVHISDTASGDSDASATFVLPPAPKSAPREVTPKDHPAGEAILARGERKTEQGIAAEGKKKEVTPDSDSVFDTAQSDVSPSAPSSVEVTRRRRKDKSALRKSDLNKASHDD
ncbi:hypothetical protein BaRGS_00007298, partial [Batillaria attramentaria]